uniref:Uncharacterized protein n=1 Tax=Panagrolaimus davidi TaxID=227884 RepID=A0A914PPX7_9BILA
MIEKWPCTIGISKKEKKATIYIFYNDKGEAIEYQKHDEKRVRCIRCDAKKNFNFDFKYFEDDPAQCQCGKPKKSSDVKKDQFRSQFLLQISGNLPYQALINHNEREEMLRQFIDKYNSMYTEKYHEHPSTTTPERFEKTIHSALMNSRYDKNEMKKLEKPEIEIPDETGGDEVVAEMNEPVVDEMEEEILVSTDEAMAGAMAGAMDEPAVEETDDAAENGLETSYQNLSLNEKYAT